MKDATQNTNEIEMKYNLIALNELMTLLGYNDKRSVRNWCEKKHIPIIELGKKEYIHKTFITQIVQDSLPVIGSRPPTDINTPSPGSKMETRYVPDNIIISKYLKKYESKNKT